MVTKYSSKSATMKMWGTNKIKQTKQNKTKQKKKMYFLKTETCRKQLYKETIDVAI